MLGFQLLVHAFKMLFHDISATVRLTIIPLIIGYLGAFLVYYALSGGSFFDVMLGDVQRKQSPMRQIFSILSASAVVLFMFIWAAVGWHRYALLEERPGTILPKLNGQQQISYFWAGFRLTLLFSVLLLPFLAFVALTNDLGQSTYSWIFFGSSILILTVWFRFSLILPAAALGKPMVPNTSWSVTRGHIGAFVTIALVSTLLNELTQFSAGYGVSEIVLLIALNWLNFALGVSLLTTIYGHFVENRPLD